MTAQAAGGPDLSRHAHPAIEDLKNALQVCEAHITLIPVGRAMTLQELAHALNDALADLDGVARLLRDALRKIEAK